MENQKELNQEQLDNASGGKKGSTVKKTCPRCGTTVEVNRLQGYACCKCGETIWLNGSDYNY